MENRSNIRNIAIRNYKMLLRSEFPHTMYCYSVVLVQPENDFKPKHVVVIIVEKILLSVTKFPVTSVLKSC